jgi:amino acid transporter
MPIVTDPTPALRRVLGTPLLVFYGLGVIIGAGIYVLVGSVLGVAGEAAPWSFILAGVLAGLTGLCYAELAVRFPEAAGAAAYVKEALGSDRLSQLAATMTVVEIGGLLLVVAAGWPALQAAPQRIGELLPAFEPGTLAGAAAGAFLAFFAFIGFENLANMAEEARRPERSLPRAILISLGLSTALYALVTAVTILALPHEELAASPAPLLLVAAEADWFSTDLFAAIALIAVANGVLIELVMLGRLLYGMTRRGWLPSGLGAVHPRLRTPVPATLCGGTAVFVLTVAVPFLHLVAVTSTITLLIFAVVNLALWRLQRRRPRSTGFRVPRFIPPAAALANVALAVTQFLH